MRRRKKADPNACFPHGDEDEEDEDEDEEEVEEIARKRADRKWKRKIVWRRRVAPQGKRKRK